MLGPGKDRLGQVWERGDAMGILGKAPWLQSPEELLKNRKSKKKGKGNNGSYQLLNVSQTSGPSLALNIIRCVVTVIERLRLGKVKVLGRC